MSSRYNFETVKVTVNTDGIAHFQLNRPKKLNAFSPQDVGDAFRAIGDDEDIKVVVASGAGRMFTAGLDLSETPFSKSPSADPARAAYQNRAMLRAIQETFTAIENCRQPVIAAVHGGCMGAGAAFVTACDIRYCTEDAFFSVKEIDVGLAADVGTLQRLPKIIGNGSLVRELCYTGRNLYSKEALDCGFVNRVEKNLDACLAEAFNLAKTITSKSPVALVGTKHFLNYSRDHSVAEGLAEAVTWNAAMLNTE
ncbi:ClpP/crotonase, partial [Backusella circina FSU 941]